MCVSPKSPDDNYAVVDSDPAFLTCCKIMFFVNVKKNIRFSTLKINTQVFWAERVGGSRNKEIWERSSNFSLTI